MTGVQTCALPIFSEDLLAMVDKLGGSLAGESADDEHHNRSHPPSTEK